MPKWLTVSVCYSRLQSVEGGAMWSKRNTFVAQTKHLVLKVGKNNWRNSWQILFEPGLRIQSQWDLCPTQTWRGSASGRRNDTTDPKIFRGFWRHDRQHVSPLTLLWAQQQEKKWESTSTILCGKHLQNIYSYIKDILCASKIFFFCHNMIIN